MKKDFNHKYICIKCKYFDDFKEKIIFKNECVVEKICENCDYFIECKTHLKGKVVNTNYGICKAWNKYYKKNHTCASFSEFKPAPCRKTRGVHFDD